MRSSFVRTTFAALAMLSAATGASAQEAADSAGRARRSTVHLLPSLGRVGGTLVGAVNGGGVADGSVPVRHQPTTMLGLAAEAATPLPWLDVRLGFTYARPQADVVEERVYRTSVKTATLDAVIRGPRVLAARPYALVGGGVAHYDFKQSYYRASNELPVRDQLVPVLHLGAGLSWNVGPYDVFAEGGGHFARYFEQDTRPTVETPSTTGGYFTLGARIPIHF